MISDLTQSIILVYSNFYIFLASLINSYGVATIFLSIASTFLMIYPLRWANKISNQEKEFQAVIAPQIAKIKNECQGSDQHHRINELYSRYSYHPIFAIRLIMGIFIQLPFLVLTFFMFEGLDALNGQSFLFLQDLGRPDSLLFGGGNLLPYIMTAINLIAALFIPSFTRKDIMQAISVSLLFFILLYNAKSILLLFWTTNNMILLVRNLSAYQKAAEAERFNFRNYWHKLHFFMQSKELLYFFGVLFIYSIIFKSIFNKSYNLYLFNNFFKMILIIFSSLFLYQTILYFKELRGRTKRKIIEIKIDFPSVNLTDMLLVLIPLAPIVQYAVLNQELLSPFEQLQFIATMAVTLFSLVWLSPYIFQKFLPVYWLMPVGLALAVTFASMPTIVVMSSWVIKPDLALLGTGLIVLFGLFFLLYLHQRKLLQTLAVFFFILNSSYAGYITYFTDKAETTSPFSKKATSVDYSNFIPTTVMKKTPDVFLLTYDSYVGQSTMQQYGINNSAQEQFLENHGFKIYPKTYSIAASSDSSMSRMLEMSHDLSKSPYSSLAGNALVPAIFKQQGYKTHGVLYPSFLMNEIGYDFSFPKTDKNYSLGLSSIFEGLKEGEFRFALINEPRNFERSEWIEKKRQVLGEKTDYPKFMYSHTGPSHSQNSGTCLPNESALFEQRLIEANNEMIQDVETVLASKRDAIIIINGDHGPYLTGDCYGLKGVKINNISQLHLQDRIGTFLAIRWPDDTFKELDKITTLQDTFEVIFKYLFESDRVLRNPTSTTTIAIGSTFPKGFVENGKIMLGSNKGRMLYEN